MSMRISGYGSSPDRQRRERAAAFRSGRRAGQKVRGLVLRYLKEGLALVRIDGQELLASIQSSPPPGVELLFIIERLEPDIVLKELTRSSEPADMDLTALARSFQSSRARLAAFEMQFFSNQSDSENPPVDSVNARHQEYSRQVLNKSEALEAFLETTEYLRHVNRSLGGLAFFYHIPWLLPQAQELEIARLGRPLETGEELEQEHCLEAWVISCLLPHAGRIEIRLFLKPPMARYRLLMERMDLAHMAQRLIDSTGDTLIQLLALELECLGVGPLPPGYTGALPALLVSRRSSGFFARV